MQVKLGYLRTVVVVLIASLVLTACSGNDGQGSTWFNLPSIPVTVDANGNASALGFNFGYIGLQPSLIQQLQTANVQELEIRIGHNGIFIFANGEALPYIAWNDTSVDTLLTVLRSGALDSMGVPGDTAASALPWLRRIGLGVTLDLPLASGATELNVPNWRGEQLVTTSGDVPTTIGPFAINALAFDSAGNGSIGGISLADLGAGITLPPNVLQILQSLNAEQVSVNTKPTGIELALNGAPLPGIAYNSESLTRALSLAQPFVAGSAMADTLGNLGPQLLGANIEATVSFTGAPAGGISLAAVPLQLQADGSLSAYGISVTNVGADLVQSLQSANVQQIYLNVLQDSLVLAVNGEPLPVITWSDRTLGLVGDLAPALGLPASTINSVLPLVQSLLSESPLGLSIAVAPAESAEPVSIDASVPELSSLPEADIQIGAVLNNGQIQSVAGLPASTLGELGIDLPALPTNVIDILNALDVGQLQITNTGSALIIRGDDETLVALTFDETSLQRALSLVGALTSNAELVNTVDGYLPILTGQAINVVVALNGGEAPATRLSNVPITVLEDGGISVYGVDLGLGSILPSNIVDALQSANVQQLNVDIQDNNLYLAANGNALPVISWNEESFGTIQQLVGSLLGVSPELLGTALQLVQTIDVGLQVSLPPTEGAEAVQVAADFDVTTIELQTPELGDLSQPIVQLILNYQGGELVEAGGVPATVLQALGIPSLNLPPNIASILTNQLGTDQVRLVGSPNMMEIRANEETLLTLHYDTAILQETIMVIEPFLPTQIATFLQDQGVSNLLEQNLLPLLTGANLNVTANLQ